MPDKGLTVSPLPLSKSNNKKLTAYSLNTWVGGFIIFIQQFFLIQLTPVESACSH